MPTINTTTGAVTSPTDIQAVLAFSDTTNGIKLFPERLDDLTDRYANELTKAGNASWYYFIGEQLYVFPIPNGPAYVLRYIKKPAALTSTPDSSPIIPTAHHRLLVLGALAKCAVMEDDPELAAIYTNMLETRFSQARASLWTRQYDETDMIKDMFWEDDTEWLW